MESYIKLTINLFKIMKKDDFIHYFHLAKNNKQKSNGRGLNKITK